MHLHLKPHHGVRPHLLQEIQDWQGFTSLLGEGTNNHEQQRNLPLCRFSQSANLRWGRLPSKKIDSPESLAWVQTLGREDVLEEEMATRASMLT